MKKGRINKFISFLEALVMVLCFTVSVSAETVPVEASTMEELQAAIEGKAESIKLTADIDVDQILWFDYSVTLDGDGHALNRGEGFGDVILLFTGEEALVENLTVDGKDCAVEFWSHDLIFDDVTLRDVPNAAVVGHENTALTMENCIVCNNTCPDTEYYAGVRGVFSYNKLIMTDCRICDNECGIEIYPFDYEKPVSTSLTITDSIIENNTELGMYAEGETRLCGSTIVRNNGYAGSTRWGGGIYQWAGSMDIGENCIITGNIAGYGGGISADNVSLALKGSCFGNTATIAGDDIYIDRYPEGEESIIPEVSMDICETQQPRLLGPSGTEEPVEGYPADENHQVSIPFYGWFEDFEDARFTSTEESTLVCEENGNLELLNGEIAALKAVWDGAFLVYDANNGKGDYQYADSVFEAGAEAVLADNMFEKPVCLFVEWNTSPDGSGESYQPGDTLTMEEDTVLYAIWKKGYVMTYLPGADGVTNLPEAAAVEDAATYVVDSTIPQREGYEFIDWTLDYSVIGETAYTVRYLEYGSDIVLADNKTIGGLLVGGEVTETAINIVKGDIIYNLIGDESQSKTLGPNAEENVITFYYAAVPTSWDYDPPVMRDYITDELYIVHHRLLGTYGDLFTEYNYALAGEPLTVYARDFGYVPLAPMERTCESVPCNHVLEYQKFQIFDEGWYRIIPGSELSWQIDGLQQKCVVAKKNNIYTIWTRDQLSEEEQAAFYESFKANVYGMSDAGYENCQFMYANGSTLDGVTINDDYILLDETEGLSLAIGSYLPGYEMIYEKEDSKILEFEFYYTYQSQRR